MEYFAKVLCASGIRAKSEWVLPKELEVRRKEIQIDNEIIRLSPLVEGRAINIHAGDKGARREEMFSFSTVEILARLIHYEADEIDSGQTQVMWSIINRVFKNKNFSSGEDESGSLKGSVRGIITGNGQYASVYDDDASGNRSYRPDKTERHWENSILLAATTCAYLGDSTYSTLSEDDKQSIRGGISRRRNINGNLLTNLIGEFDSFRKATDTEKEKGYMVFGGNHFFNYPHQ
jgi:hypothetical protein